MFPMPPLWPSTTPLVQIQKKFVLLYHPKYTTSTLHPQIAPKTFSTPPPPSRNKNTNATTALEPAIRSAGSVQVLNSSQTPIHLSKQWTTSSSKINKVHLILVWKSASSPPTKTSSEFNQPSDKSKRNPFQLWKNLLCILEINIRMRLSYKSKN